MKFLSYFKISLFLSVLLITFATHAKSDDTAKIVALEIFGQELEEGINKTLEPIKTSNQFNENEKIEYIKHLKAHFYHIFTPLAIKAVKTTFTNSEMNQLKKNPYLIQDEPFDSKGKQASVILAVDIQNKSNDITKMVSMVTAHHLCLQKGNGKCPTTPYSEYPTEF